MDIKSLWNRNKPKRLAIWGAVKDLSVWIFGSFLLPLLQLFIMTFSTKPKSVDEALYNVVFVTVASFLTGVFFVTSFWKQNRMLVRMMLVISYLISAGLFIVSQIQTLFDIKVFVHDIFECGLIVAIILAILVGFFCKYDEKLIIPREIADQANRINKGIVDGKEIKL